VTPKKTSIRPTFSGVAVVCCLHDREKRQVTTPDHVAKLGLSLTPPRIYNPRVDKIFLCACCENMFVSLDDTPKYCSICDPSKPFVHAPGGPLNPPNNHIQ